MDKSKTPHNLPASANNFGFADDSDGSPSQSHPIPKSTTRHMPRVKTFPSLERTVGGSVSPIPCARWQCLAVSKSQTSLSSLAYEQSTSKCRSPSANACLTIPSKALPNRPQLLHCHDSVASASSLSDHLAASTKARNKLLWACALCLCFMAVECAGGIVSGSLAVLTDAAHLSIDLCSFVIQVFGLRLALRPRTRRMNFGWHRAEPIGALMSVLLLWVVTGVLVYVAIERIVHGHLEVNSLVMLITSSFGILVNIVLATVLHPPHHHGHDHGHDHGHTHGDDGHAEHDQHHEHNHGHHQQHNHTHDHAHRDRIEHADLERGDEHDEICSSSSREESKKFKLSDFYASDNLNIRAALIHVVGDLLQSIGVFIAAMLIYFIPGAQIADPICTFLFSVLVMFTTVPIVRDIINVLMEGSPFGNIEKFEQVRVCLTSIAGVVRVHNLRVWGLTTDKFAVNAHLVIADKAITSHQAVLQEALCALRKNFDNICDITIQIEEYDACMDTCNTCSDDDPSRHV